MTKYFSPSLVLFFLLVMSLHIDRACGCVRMQREREGASREQRVVEGDVRAKQTCTHQRERVRGTGHRKDEENGKNALESNG